MVTNNQPPEAGWESLAEAIIMQSCTDYMYCLLFEQAPHSNARDVNKRLIELFFTSPWFQRICPGHRIDGDLVIEQLQKAARRADNLVYFTRKLRGGKWEVYELAHPDKDLGLRYEKSEDANSKAARLNGLKEWQYMIAATGKAEYYRKRKDGENEEQG